MTENLQPKTENQSQPTQPARPNEQGHLNIDDFLRIYDPNTRQIMVEQRA